MSEVKGYSPQIEKGEILTKPIESVAYVDQTNLFEFPFALDQLPRMLAHSEETSAVADLATRTITEGRSYTYFPVVFRRKDGVRFIDLSVKGGGSEIKPNVRLFENQATEEGVVQYDTDLPIPESITKNGENLIVRYHTKPIVTLTSLLGVHSTEAGMSDKHMSELLEKKGLRTRTLVAAWELPEQTIMSTPKGELTAKEFIQESGVKPGLEMWALRCKYRVQDILRYVFETENPNPEISKFSGMKLHPTRIDNRSTDADRKSHTSIVESLSEDQRDLLNNNFTQLAREIAKRAQYDTDPRFTQLAEKYQSIDGTNLQDFYIDYLLAYSQVLGEQFAVMQNSGAISGMFNLQNITLLAELVDHDVTMIDGKVMNSQGNLEELTDVRKKRFGIDPEKIDLNNFNQLFVGYDSVRQMISALSRAGILKMDETDMRKLLKIYLGTFRATTGNSYINHFNLAQEKIDGERQKVADIGADYFGRDGNLAFCEDVLDMFSS